MTLELGIFLVFILGVLLGVVIVSWIWCRRIYGAFKIDCSDPSKDICRLELDSMDLDALARRKYIVLKIVTRLDDSRE